MNIISFIYSIVYVNCIFCMYFLVLNDFIEDVIYWLGLISIVLKFFFCIILVEVKSIFFNCIIFGVGYFFFLWYIFLSGLK